MRATPVGGRWGVEREESLLTEENPCVLYCMVSGFLPSEQAVGCQWTLPMINMDIVLYAGSCAVAVGISYILSIQLLSMIDAHRTPFRGHRPLYLARSRLLPRPGRRCWYYRRKHMYVCLR